MLLWMWCSNWNNVWSRCDCMTLRWPQYYMDCPGYSNAHNTQSMGLFAVCVLDDRMCFGYAIGRNIVIKRSAKRLCRLRSRNKGITNPLPHTHTHTNTHIVESMLAINICSQMRSEWTERMNICNQLFMWCNFVGEWSYICANKISECIWFMGMCHFCIFKLNWII